MTLDGAAMTLDMDLDAYYRGEAAGQVQRLADRFARLAGEAEQAGAEDAAVQLSDLSTQLLDLGVELAAHRHEVDRR